MNRVATTLTLILTCLLIAAGTHAADEAMKIEEWSKFDAPQFKLPFGGGGDGSTSVRAYSLDGTRMGEQLKKNRKVTDTTLEAVFTVNKKGKCTDVISFIQIREQFEQLGGEGGLLSGSGNSTERSSADEPDKVMKVDLDATPLGAAEVAGIPGEKMQVDVKIHEEGLTVAEGGGVTVRAVSVYGKSEALDAKARFETNHREMLGSALQLDGFIRNLRSTFMANPQIEQAMGEYRKMNLPEGSTQLSGVTEITTYPDPRQKKKEDDAGSDDSLDASASGLAKKIGGMFGGKKDKDESASSKDPKPIKVEQRIVSAGPGGGELLELPDECLTKLEKINAE